MTAQSTPAPSTSAWRWVTVAYLLVLGALVFLPFGRGMDLGDRLNFEPFATIDRALELGPRSPSFRLMLGNIAAFVPLGILLPMAIRSRWPLATVLIGAVALSSAIELGQLAISVWLGFAYRSTDVDDVILNVSGAVVGYGLFVTLRLLGRAQPIR
ncbi:MAG: VanZ family protein [Chloroflexota bacterium]